MADGRTSIVLDEDRIAEAQQGTGLASKREVVDFALRIDFDDDYDPKAGWDRKL
jgi:Arc/MetJ family transcription regulator